MLDHALEQQAEILVTTRDKYGDYQTTGTQTISCRFRVITELDLLPNREDIRSDALLWVSADTQISEGTLVNYDSETYKVQRIVEARRLRGDTVYFKKCLLEKHYNE